MNTIKTNKQGGLVPMVGIFIVLAVSLGSYMVMERAAREEPSSPSPVVYNSPPVRTPAPSPVPAPVGTGIYGKVTTEIVMGPAGRIVPFTSEVIVKDYVTKQEVKRFTPNADGSFNISIAAGSYYFIPASGYTLWAERYPKVIAVTANSYTSAEVFFASAMQ